MNRWTIATRAVARSIPLTEGNSTTVTFWDQFLYLVTRNPSNIWRSVFWSRNKQVTHHRSTSPWSKCFTASLISTDHRCWCEAPVFRNYFCVVTIQGRHYVKELDLCLFTQHYKQWTNIWMSCSTISRHLTNELALHTIAFVCRKFKFPSCLAQLVIASICQMFYITFLNEFAK